MSSCVTSCSTGLIGVSCKKQKAAPATASAGRLNGPTSNDKCASFSHGFRQESRDRKFALVLRRKILAQTLKKMAARGGFCARNRLLLMRAFFTTGFEVEALHRTRASPMRQRPQPLKHTTQWMEETMSSRGINDLISKSRQSATQLEELPGVWRLDALRC